MKKIFLILTFLNLSYINAQSKGFNANDKQYLAKLDSISKGVTEPGYAIYIDDYKITEEDKEWLDLASKKDFTSVTSLDKKDAIAKFGTNGEKGAVLLTPFKDRLLDIQYYTGITNKVLLGEMIPLMAKGDIQNNPLLVVDGIPLRGEEIVKTINALSENDITRMSVLKKNAAFKIYGIRALPGVLLIFTEEYDKKNPKK